MRDQKIALNAKVSAKKKPTGVFMARLLADRAVRTNAVNRYRWMAIPLLVRPKPPTKMGGPPRRKGTMVALLILTTMDRQDLSQLERSIESLHHLCESLPEFDAAGKLRGKLGRLQSAMA